MDCKFYLCMLFIILGTISVQGARPENKQENPIHEDAKRVVCSGNGKYCLNGYCPQGTNFCGYDFANCGSPPQLCCCKD
ncbi:small cysteine-rich protein 1-like [Oculina patagonica]